MGSSAFTLLGIFAILLVIGVPFAFAIGISTLATVLIEDISPVILVQYLVSGISLYSLLSFQGQGNAFFRTSNQGLPPGPMEQAPDPVAAMRAPALAATNPDV